MAFRFKILFRVQRVARIGDGIVNERISPAEDELSYYLRSSGLKHEHEGEDLDLRLTELVPYSVEGGPYPTEDQAEEAGWKAKSALLAWATQRRIAIDFNLGTTARPYVEDTKSFSLQVVVSVLKERDSTVEEFAASILPILRVNRIENRTVLAMELFTASFLDSALSSQFVTRVCSVETLIEQSPNSGETIELLSRLKQLAKESIIPEDERMQILSALGNQQRESIKRAGARLVESLIGDKEYDGVAAARLFRDVYDIRSSLVHTGDHGLDDGEFKKTAERCMLLVGDLLNATLVRETHDQFPGNRQ